MSKLSAKAKTSKLNLDQDSHKQKESLIKSIKYNEHPRSYRLDSEILHILKSTLDKLNEISPKKVSASKLLKALIFISQDLDESKMLKALKEVW